MAEMVLTQNFKTWATQMLIGTTLNATTQHYSTGNNSASINAFTSTSIPKFMTPFKSTDGGQRRVAVTGSSTYLSRFSSIHYFDSGNDTTQGNVFFEIGSGNTAPTVNDFKLETPETEANYSIQLNPHNLENRDEKIVLICLITVNANVNLSISEIGMLRKYYEQSAAGTPTYKYLFGRCVLDEPVTLAVGESKTFELVISLF